ncbi:Nramp family divalent metal transporter, partial [Bacteroidota bacterium]
TIGTGSVTSMSKAGSAYGMQLIWVLFLSAFFAWILMEAYGRYAIATGSTAMYGYRKHIKYGKYIAIIIIVGVTFGQWNALAGILGLSANAFYEIIAMYNPGISSKEYGVTLVIGIVLIGIMFLFLLNGKYSFFEKVLVVFVSIMGAAFLISALIVPPPLEEILKGFIPSIPKNERGASDYMLVAAFVGTTMAAPTFVVRPLFLKGKGWTRDNAKEQSRDALSSAILMFLISGAVMAASAGAIYLTGGEPIKVVLDMVQALEPVAGRFAVLIFMFGAVSAGLSSIFPILMVLPLLIADYKSGSLDTKSRQFRILTGVAAVVGLTVLIIGANPVEAQIITQVFSVFILPAVIATILYVVNRNNIMGDLKAGIYLNLGLWLALIFSLVISLTGIMGIVDLVNQF